MEKEDIKEKKCKKHGPLYWIIILAGMTFIVSASMSIGEKLAKTVEPETKSTQETKSEPSEKEDNSGEETTQSPKTLTDYVGKYEYEFNHEIESDDCGEYITLEIKEDGTANYVGGYVCGDIERATGKITLENNVLTLVNEDCIANGGNCHTEIKFTIKDGKIFTVEKYGYGVEDSKKQVLELKKVNKTVIDYVGIYKYEFNREIESDDCGEHVTLEIKEDGTANYVGGYVCGDIERATGKITLENNVLTLVNEDCIANGGNCHTEIKFTIKEGKIFTVEKYGYGVEDSKKQVLELKKAN